MRQQHHVLQQLELTTRKLENLTDIERQLSRPQTGWKFLAGYAPHEVKSPPSTDEVTLMSHKPAHLLLVDEAIGIAETAWLRLTSEGYSVVTAESGAEGLRVLNREK